MTMTDILDDMTNTLKPCPLACATYLVPFDEDGVDAPEGLMIHPENGCLLQGWVVLPDEYDAWNTRSNETT